MANVRKVELTITCDKCAKEGRGRIAMVYKSTQGPSKKGRSYDMYECQTPGCGQTATANYDHGVFIGAGQTVN